MAKRNFKKVATKHGYVWLENDGRFIAEKHGSEYFLYRIWDRTPKFTKNLVAYDIPSVDLLSYDNIEDASDYTIPRFKTLTEAGEFLANTEELNRLYKAIDERFGMEFKPF